MKKFLRILFSILFAMAAVKGLIDTLKMWSLDPFLNAIICSIISFFIFPKRKSFRRKADSTQIPVKHFDEDSFYYDEEPFDEEKYNRENRQIIEAFNAAFDLESAEGIRSITMDELAKWSKLARGVPSTPEQILQKNATKHKRNGNLDLAIECLKKSNEYSSYADLSYDRRHYERLVNYLKLARRFDEAKSIQYEIDLIFDEKSQKKYKLYEMIEHAKQSGDDLLIMSKHMCTCGECAKYQGRVYSISGNSNVFPKLPERFLEYGGVHEGCNHYFYIYHEYISDSGYKDIVEYSNRPYVDDRTDVQKEQYEVRHRNIEEAKRDKENYYWCWEHLEDLCPKSLSSYRRMKKINSKNFQKLKEAAMEYGRDIS